MVWMTTKNYSAENAKGELPASSEYSKFGPEAWASWNAALGGTNCDGKEIERAKV